MITNNNKIGHIKISMLQVNIYRINSNYNMELFYKILNEQINFRGKYFTKKD